MASVDATRSAHPWIARNRHALLLAALLLAVVTQPLVAHDRVAAQLAYDLLVAAVALGVLTVVLAQPWERRVASILLLPAVVLTILRYYAPDGASEPYLAVYELAVASFLVFVLGAIVRDIFRGRSITADAVFGAFAGYLLLGVAWGGVYSLAERLAPGAFVIAQDIRWQLEAWHLRRALFNYFSFATMASLGYSEITAVTPLANTLTWLQVMTAQFYLAVVVSQIVGLKLARFRGGDAGDRRQS